MRPILLRCNSSVSNVAVVIAYIDDDDRFVYYATQTKNPGWKDLYHIYRVKTEEGIGGRRSIPSEVDPVDRTNYAFSSVLLRNLWSDEEDFAVVLDKIIEDIKWEMEETRRTLVEEE